MTFYDLSSKPLRLLILMVLAGCAEGAVEPVLDTEESTSADLRKREHPRDRRRKGDDPCAPCTSPDRCLDAGAGPAADAGSNASADAGTGKTPDAAADAGTGRTPDAARPLGPTTAVGANAGDFCSPVEGERRYWARCEERRGLRCQPPSPEYADAPSTCACAPGATFVEGLCSHNDWGSVDAGNVATELLGPSTALGAKVGDQCTVGAFARDAWALCDARRGLTCRVLRNRAGSLDVNVVCQCPEGATFVEGVCTED